MVIYASHCNSMKLKNKGRISKKKLADLYIYLLNHSTKIEQKCMTFDHDFCYLFSKKGENNNQSRGQKSCLSAQYSTKYSLIVCKP